MIIGDRIRELRKRKGITQGVVEERTGLLRCYVSRVENNHTVPSVETLEKFARALEVPMYQLFYDGEQPPLLTTPTLKRGAAAKDARNLAILNGYGIGRVREIGSCFW